VGWQCGRREYEFVMKQTVIDILIYLFEHYIDDDIELDADRDELKSELRDAGFEAGQVAKAFDWLQELAVTRDHADDFPTPAQTSFRIFTVEEQRKLDAECRGFLHFLSQSAVLDSARRELVIDRVLALESDEIDIAQLKWIILMVLFNQPGQEQAFVWMEDLVMDDLYGNLH
jgi:Smg protein